ncbi:dihydroxyacetone kinase subunit DhaK, partial [Corallococcus carmarthensis]|uniref:dihydroxyacetone kinase subunit DhaK n=1 Tax=Corallococcus carmarthensis TaxID=2316728 RepID=UPI00148D81F3
VLVHKVAGAAAAAGVSLAEVAREATEAAAALGSMGVALGPCTVPAAGRPGFTLEEDEVELGLGIHGEQGVRRVALQPVDALVDTLLSAIVEDRKVGRGDRVALMVNGLGGTPPMELAIVTRRALAFLAERGVTVERAWQGTFLSALEMPGCSLTVLKVDDARLARLDAPTEAPAWPGRGQVVKRRQVVPVRGALPTVEGHPKPQPMMAQVRAAALAVADAWDAAEARLTELDSRAGDGDLGLSLARGAAAIRALPERAWATPSGALTELGQALRRNIAGSSGPFYATALLRAARYLANRPVDAAAWAKAFEVGVEAVSELGGARPGDRTMVDALHPAAVTLVRAVREGISLGEAWAEATRAAEQGAEATASMSPRLGRASYLGERAKGIPDAGAAAVVIWMQALRGRVG